MNGSEGIPVQGVKEMEHTADVGLEISAPDLPELFRRAALGSMWLILEREAECPGAARGGGDLGLELGDPAPLPKEPRLAEERIVELVEADLPALLRAWLRTLLFWEETEGFVTVDSVVALTPAPLCSTPDGQAFGLRARVRGRVDGGPRVREIKGVTLHGLEVEREEETWTGKVIFDV
jgi:SHS2 domain-containing protein